MTPDSTSPNAEMPDEPVDVLRGLELEPTPDFTMRVRRGIERRHLGCDLIGFYWAALGRVSTEWLSAILSPLTRRRQPRQGQR